MIMRVSEILQLTKTKMQGKWQLAFAVVAVVMAVAVIVPQTLTLTLGGLDGIANLIWMFAVTLPIGTGAVWLFLGLHDGKEGELIHIFDVFQDLRRIVRAWMLKMLLVFPQLIAFLIPGLIALINYSQMEFILKDNPGMAGKEALSLSKEIMRGNKMRYVLLYLRIFWPTILIMIAGFSMMVNVFITADTFGGEIWVDTVLWRRANSAILISNLAIHVFNAYARPAFAIFYRDLKPLEAVENEGDGFEF
jgi:uncharacterized membrane protein